MSSAAKKIEWNTQEILEEFGKFPLFETFPKTLLSELATASEIIELPKNSEILKQGQRNDQIFFLSLGAAGVYVDGARVNKLSIKGDLLGEMSVITNRPVGATIIAQTDVTLVRVDTRHFLNMPAAERDFLPGGSLTSVRHRTF